MTQRQILWKLKHPPPHNSCYKYDRKQVLSLLWSKGIRILLLLLLLFKVLQLQRSFGLLNEFFPFGPGFYAVPPVCYFHICYITYYIILPPIFRRRNSAARNKQLMQKHKRHAVQCIGVAKFQVPSHQELNSGTQYYPNIFLIYHNIHGRNF